MGFISNPEQEAQLISPAFQNAVVDGLLRSIVRYRDLVEQGFFLEDPLADDAPPDEVQEIRRPIP
jgi:hypothetical protein